MTEDIPTRPIDAPQNRGQTLLTQGAIVKAVPETEEEIYSRKFNEDYSARWRTMAAISPEQIALIAASLSRRKRPAEESIRMAYEFLDLAVFGQLVLREKLHTPRRSSSIADQIDFSSSIDPRSKEVINLMLALAPRDQNGVLVDLVVPFPKGLEAALPTIDRPGRREAAFKEWLKENRGYNFVEHNWIDQWKKSGIPWHIFQFFYLEYAAWREKKTSAVRDQAGRKGQRAKLEKQKAPQVVKKKRKG